MEVNKIILSENIEAIKKMPDNSIDAIITDSPYGLGKEPNAIACISDWITKGYHEVKGRGFMNKNGMRSFRNLFFGRNVFVCETWWIFIIIFRNQNL